MAGGSGSAQAKNDVHSTTKLVIADMQLSGNLDLIYASDANEPARVSYARPPGDAAPLIAEKRGVENELDDLLVGMLAWLDEALEATPPGDDSTKRGHISPWAGSDPQTYVEMYVPTLTAGDPVADVVAGDGTITTIGTYQSPAGSIAPITDTVPPGHSSGQHCRAPAEEVVPTTLSIQVRCNPNNSSNAHIPTPNLTLSQIDFPVIPCTGDSYPDCILLDPIYASKSLLPTLNGDTLPICSIVPRKTWCEKLTQAR